MFQRRSSLLRALALFLALAGLTACDRNPPQVVSLEKRQALPAPEADPAEKTLTLCVGSMITPQDGYVYYRQLIDYLSERLAVHITALDPGNYRDVNRLLETGKADVAFVCAGPYVEGHARFGPFGIPPVVTGNHVDPATREALQRAFLAFSEWRASG